MRTTLTLDPDVARRVREAMARNKLSLKRIVNDALRAGLASVDKAAPPRFIVQPHPFQARPGIDLDRLNQLVDELDVEAARKSLSK